MAEFVTASAVLCRRATSTTGDGLVRGEARAGAAISLEEMGTDIYVINGARSRSTRRRPPAPPGAPRSRSSWPISRRR